MIASAQTTDTEVFAFTAVLVLKFLSRKFLLINRKKMRNFQNIFETCKRSFITAF